MIDIPAVDRHHLLVTGATGLLGSYLVRDLLLDGQPLAVVVRRSRRESPEARVERIVSDWEIELGKRLPRPRVLAGDLTMPRCGLSDADLGWVARHCSGLLHNAASLSFRGSDRAAEPWLSNVTGTANMLDVVRAAARVTDGCVTVAVFGALGSEPALDDLVRRTRGLARAIEEAGRSGSSLPEEPTKGC